MMKKNHKRLISALLIALMLDSQLTTAAWAENMVIVDAAGGGGNHRKETGYATPAEAEQEEEKTDSDDGQQKEEKADLDDGKQKEDDENLESEKMVIGWEFVDDENLSGEELSLIGVNSENRADFETVVSMLPTKVKVEIDGDEISSVDHISDPGADGRGGNSGESHTVRLSVKSWNCPEYRQDEDGLWPFTGEYEFTAELPDGYACDPPPSVRVILGGAELYMISDLFTVNGLRYKELGPDTVKLMGYDGEKPTGILIIPESVTRPSNGREYRVVRIGTSAFEGCDGLTGDLVIPDTVTEIGAMAFKGCKFTGSLTLSDSLVRIENAAFYGSQFPGELKLPDTLEHIGKEAFYNGGFSGDLTIPDGVTYIGPFAFRACPFMWGKLTLSKGLKEIPEGAFAFCGFEGELVLPEGLTEIGPGAFFRGHGFSGNLKIPDGMERIGRYAFDQAGFGGFDTTNQAVADLLINAFVPERMIRVNGLPYPESYAVAFVVDEMRYRPINDNEVELLVFIRGDVRRDLNIPAVVKDPNTGKTYSVTRICRDAFRRWKFTGGLTLPDSLTFIGDEAFAENRFTGDLTIPESVTEIGGKAFWQAGFSGDLNIKGNITEIEDHTFRECGFTGTLSMADTVTTIRESAFDGCSFTGSLNLPAGLRYIGIKAFYGCKNLTGTLNIPEAVIEIEEGAFAVCEGLTSAHLGSNLQKLGAQVFPKSLPLSTDSPRVQLLINASLDQDVLADTSWNGKEDVPDGAIVAIKTDVAVAGDKRIGKETVITVLDGNTLTVDGSLVVDGSLIVDGTIFVDGLLVINGAHSGSGTLIIGKNGRIEGDTAGFFVVYYHSSGGGGGSAVNTNILRGSWERTETGIWKFRRTNGSYAKNQWGIAGGLWYYFDSEGQMLTGWQFINSQWYYLCKEQDTKTKAGLKEGAMLTGWYFDPSYQAWFYLDTDGAMAVGLKMIDGKQYYFNPESDGTRGALQD